MFETYAKLLPLLKDCFECQGSLTVVMVDWDKSRVQFVQLGEKVIKADNWQEERFTKMMAQLFQELETKEEALAKLHGAIQKTKEAKQLLF